MTRFRVASGALERRLERGLLHPIDFLRTRMTRGLQVCAGDRPVRRGEHLDAHVTISRPGSVERVEAGLVCTAFYASAVSDGRGGRSRGTASATVHEAWLPVEGAPGVHSVRLTVPANAPFSYEGTWCASGGRSSPAGAGRVGSTRRQRIRSRCCHEPAA
jgi:hypothetical protein